MLDTYINRVCTKLLAFPYPLPPNVSGGRKHCGSRVYLGRRTVDRDCVSGASKDVDINDKNRDVIMTPDWVILCK